MRKLIDVSFEAHREQVSLECAIPAFTYTLEFIVLWCCFKWSNQNYQKYGALFEYSQIFEPCISCILCDTYVFHAHSCFFLHATTWNIKVLSNQLSGKNTNPTIHAGNFLSVAVFLFSQINIYWNPGFILNLKFKLIERHTMTVDI